MRHLEQHAPPLLSLAQAVGELSAVLGAAYHAFLHERLERRAGRRGKAHRRAFVVLADMVNEMVAEAEPHGEGVCRMAMAELDRDRADTEAEVIADGGVLDVAHEWAAFLAEMDRPGL
jgi:hypothetical protein